MVDLPRWWGRRSTPLDSGREVAADDPLILFGGHIVHSLAEGVMVYSAAGRLLFWNPAAAQILQRELAQEQEKPLQEWVILREDGARMATEDLPLARALVRQESTRGAILGYVAPQGGLRWLEVNAEPVPPLAGMPPAVVLTFSDITSRRRSDEALRHSQDQLEFQAAAQAAEAERARRRLAALLEVAEEAQCVFASDGRLEAANAAFRTLFGAADSGVAGLEDWWLRALPDPGQRRSLAGRWLDLAGESSAARPLALELPLCCLDGSTREFALKVLPIDDGFLASLVDLGARRAAAAAQASRLQALEAARQEAEEASRAKSAFLASISHEVRNPLNAILGMSEVLRDQRLDDEQRGLVDTILAAGRGMRTILDEVLDFARIEAGRLVVEHETFLLEPLLDQTVRLWMASAERKGLQLVRAATPAATPPCLSGDPRRLAQILGNLIGNAIKFTDHGQVRLAVDSAPAGPGEVRLRFQVEDTGRGIPTDQQDLVFEPFIQLPAADGSRRVGTGLGLAICRELATRLGGRVGLHSVPGRGSTFWVELPFGVAVAPALPPTAALAPPAEAPAAPLRGLRALVVDDNPLNLEVACRLLERAGAEVRKAASGRAALDAVSAAPEWAHAVLLDIQMPQMDGLEVCRRLRRLPGDAERLILAVSAGALPEQRAQALHAGMDGFVAKPFHGSDLVTAITQAQATRRRVPAARATDAEAVPPASAERVDSAATRETAQVARTAETFPQPDGHDGEQAWRRMQGDRELYLRSLRLFELELVRLCRELERLLTQPNLFLLARCLHRLKGASATVAAARLAAQAERLETGVARLVEMQASRGERLPALPEETAAELRALLKACETHRQSLAASLRALPRTPAPEATPPVAEQAFRETLQRLLGLLDNADLAALDVYRSFAPALAPWLDQERRARLQTALDQLAFAQAARLLRAALPGGRGSAASVACDG